MRSKLRSEWLSQGTRLAGTQRIGSEDKASFTDTHCTHPVIHRCLHYTLSYVVTRDLGIHWEGSWELLERAPSLQCAMNHLKAMWLYQVVAVATANFICVQAAGPCVKWFLALAGGSAAAEEHTLTCRAATMGQEAGTEWGRCRVGEVMSAEGRR